MLTSPPFTKKPGTDVADEVEKWLHQQFADLSKTHLSPSKPPAAGAVDPMTLAYTAVRDAVANLFGPKPGHIDNFGSSSFNILESQTSFRFALDPRAFQIICKTDDSSAKGLDWPRFGLSLVNKDTLTAFFSPSMYDPGIDLATKAPDAALFLNHLTAADTSVVAFLGTARIDANQGAELIHYVRDAVLGLDKTAFMTGGYRGAYEHSYGVTRAGFDVPKRLDRPTIWVMCEAGVNDSSQSPDAKSICGKNWGDDTPAMEACSDGAIFFRNIPPGKMYGAWTFVEIANFVASPKNKPIAIVDPKASAPTEKLFGRDVPLFATGTEAAKFVAAGLDAVRKQRKHFDVVPTTMRTIQRGAPQDDIQMVDVAFPNSTYLALYLPLIPTDAVTAALRQAGIKVPDAAGPAQWSVLRALWQDMMVLEVAGKIKIEMGTSRAEILALPTPKTIDAYAACRRTIQAALTSGEPLLFAP